MATQQMIRLKNLQLSFSNYEKVIVRVALMLQLQNNSTLSTACSADNYNVKIILVLASLQLNMECLAVTFLTSYSWPSSITECSKYNVALALGLKTDTKSVILVVYAIQIMSCTANRIN